MNKQRLRRVALVAGIVVVVSWAAAGLLFDSYYIPSDANSPTLLTGDRVLARPVGSAERGDIVVYEAQSQSPDAQSQSPLRVSRVVAVAGDSIGATSQGVFLNGQMLDEQYLDPGTSTSEFATTVVPAGHIFLMSDNRPTANDSRVFGPVPASAIRGRVVWIWAPPGRFGSP